MSMWRAAVSASVLCWMLLAPAGASATSSGAYVADYGGATVSQFVIGAGGLLSPMTTASVAAGTNPFDVAVSPDGRSVYVTNSGDGTVSQYSVGAGGTLTPKMPATVMAGSGPVAVAVSPDGKSVYVADANQAAVSQFDVGAGGALSAKTPAIVAAGTDPEGVAISPDGKSVYVTSTADRDVWQYDVGAGGALSPKTVATAPDGLPSPRPIAISPDGKSVYVGNVGDGTPGGSSVSQYDVGAGGLLSPKTPSSVATAEGTAGIAVSPDGKSVYVTNTSFGVISQYDVGAGGGLSPKTPTTVPAGSGPFGIAVNPDGRSVYAANEGGTVSQYDIGAGGLLSAKTPTSVAAGTQPTGIAVVPDQAPVAAFSTVPAPAGSPTTFNGSASSDLDGAVARYDWAFGDGSTLPNGGPTPTHTYAAAGVYTATLTVTDDGGCSTAFVFTGQTALCNGSTTAVTTRTVTVPVPSRLMPVPTVTKFMLVASPVASSTGVSFSLACQAAAGSVCRGLAQLTTLERLLGTRIVALNARSKRHSKRVLVGATSFTLAAGAQKKIAVPLNRTGKRLLARFKRIPATLKITLLNTKPPTTITTKTTIKAKKKKKHKRHH